MAKKSSKSEGTNVGLTADTKARVDSAVAKLEAKEQKRAPKESATEMRQRQQKEIEEKAKKLWEEERAFAQKLASSLNTVLRDARKDQGEILGLLTQEATHHYPSMYITSDDRGKFGVLGLLNALIATTCGSAGNSKSELVYVTRANGDIDFSVVDRKLEY